MTIPSLRPRLIACLAAAALPAAGCGSSHRAIATTGSSTPASQSTTQPPAATDQRSGAATVAPSASAPPAGGPVPRNFDPVSFTAISDRRFWLLGTAPCPRRICTSIVRTTDGGAHFVGIPAPVAPLARSGSDPGVAALRFANRLDGFAGADGLPQPLYATHDGGLHWRRTLGDVLAFTVSGGRVYAVTGSRAGDTVRGLRLASSPADADRWRTTALPVPAGSSLLAITAHGGSVWLSLTPAGNPRAQALLYSRDSGITLSLATSPCTPGLGGDLQAASARVLWAVCPTGTMAAAWRSTDAGAQWTQLTAPGLELSNGARLGVISESAAVIAPGGIARPLRTTDGGRSFAPVSGPQGAQASWEWIGFTDPSTGSALLAGAGGPARLWRSADGGADWSGPVAIH